MALKLNLSVFYFMDRNLGFLIWSNALSPKIGSEGRRSVAM